jgi:hypothetical protein
MMFLQIERPKPEDAVIVLLAKVLNGSKILS